MNEATKRYHLFLGIADENGMDAYKGFLTLDEVIAILRLGDDVWAQLVESNEDGSLRLAGEYWWSYENITPTERYRLGTWVFTHDCEDMEVIRIHQMYQSQKWEVIE